MKTCHPNETCHICVDMMIKKLHILTRMKNTTRVTTRDVFLHPHVLNEFFSKDLILGYFSFSELLCDGNPPFLTKVMVPSKSSLISSILHRPFYK
jgi:hypothetical protein